MTAYQYRSFVLCATLTFACTSAFFQQSSTLFKHASQRNTAIAETLSSAGKEQVSLSLEKPLGLVLEEVEEGESSGVFVKEIAETGSAVSHADKIVNAKLSSVCGTDVSSSDFDSVMDLIVNAPSVVDLEFSLPEAPVEYRAGAAVSIVVKQSDKPDLILPAKVGDNLRQTLLDNDVTVYKGLKQTLGNCGGAGQCTFCAVDLLDSDGWLERSDYEAGKLKRFPKARLACLNNIQGPATIIKTER